MGTQYRQDIVSGIFTTIGSIVGLFAILSVLGSIGSIGSIASVARNSRSINTGSAKSSASDKEIREISSRSGLTEKQIQEILNGDTYKIREPPRRYVPIDPIIIEPIKLSRFIMPKENPVKMPMPNISLDDMISRLQEPEPVFEYDFHDIQIEKNYTKRNIRISEKILFNQQNYPDILPLTDYYLWSVRLKRFLRNGNVVKNVEKLRFFQEYDSIQILEPGFSSHSDMEENTVNDLNDPEIVPQFQLPKLIRNTNGITPGKLVS